MPIAGERTSPQRSAWLFLVPLASLYTLIDAVKPLQVDDAAYYYYAAHLAETPADPYGFTVFWEQWPQPANEVLAPPVLPYWWSLAIRLFGDRPFWWKLWLLPFSLLFVVALHALFHRFARGLERPLLVLTVFSPTFLPSFNLMLDVPSVALGLSAVVLFLHACRRNTWTLALLAGGVAGLAMQTKYTGFLVPVILLLYALLTRRLRLALAATLVAGVLFMAWEWYVFHVDGASHFLTSLRSTETTLVDKLLLVPALVIILGGVAPAVGLLALVALGGGRAAVTIVGSMVVLAFAVIAARGEHREIVMNQVLDRVPFALLGLLLGVLVLLVSGRLLLRRNRRLPPLSLFLLLWLGLEVLGYTALTPFPAVRRVMGIVIVLTLLVGRLAARSSRVPQARALLHGITGGGVVLGLLFACVDYRDAIAQRSAVERAAAFVQPAAGETVWYVGHWSFQFYAERAGMKSVIPDLSLLEAGDWLVVPEERFQQQQVLLDPKRLELVAEPSVRDCLPLRTVRCYYGGDTPMEHQSGPRIGVRVWRVTKAFVPANSIMSRRAPRR